MLERGLSFSLAGRSTAREPALWRLCFCSGRVSSGLVSLPANGLVLVEAVGRCTGIFCNAKSRGAWFMGLSSREAGG